MAVMGEVNCWDDEGWAMNDGETDSSGITEQLGRARSRKQVRIQELDNELRHRSSQLVLQQAGYCRTMSGYLNTLSCKRFDLY